MRTSRRDRGTSLFAVHGGTLSALLFLSGTAAAEPDQETRARATQLHRQAEVARKAKDLARACQLYEEAQSIDPTAPTLARVAECHASEGRLATALRMYTNAFELVPQVVPERRKAVTEGLAERLHELEPRVPKLVVLAAEAAVEIRVDEHSVSPEALATAWPLDVGSHAILVNAVGYSPARCSFTAEERGVTEVRILLGESGSAECGAEAEGRRSLLTLVLSPLPHPQTSGAEPTAVALAERAAPSPATPKASTANPGSSRAHPRGVRDPSAGSGPGVQRTIGIVLGAAGVVGLGVGGYFSLRTLDLVRDADCNEQNVCSEAGGEAIRKAGRTQTAALVSAGAGLAAAGASVVLLVAAPRRHESRHGLTLEIGDRSVALRGPW